MLSDSSPTMTSFLFHPLTTFLLGAFLGTVAIGFLLASIAGPNQTAQQVEDYKSALATAGTNGPPPNTPGESAALEQFTTFLQSIGDKAFVEENCAKVYAPSAYLNDTIVTHHGPEEIKAYFLETAETMTSYQVTIDDTFRSGPDHYVRWTMIFSAPKLGNGEPIESVGISQVRFTTDGQVAAHQDFWDSGTHIYGQIPIVNGLISQIKKRMSSQ